MCIRDRRFDALGQVGVGGAVAQAIGPVMHRHRHERRHHVGHARQAGVAQLARRRQTGAADGGVDLVAESDDEAAVTLGPVSYTHLDVYKRQTSTCARCATSSSWPASWACASWSAPPSTKGARSRPSRAGAAPWRCTASPRPDILQRGLTARAAAPKMPQARRAWPCAAPARSRRPSLLSLIHI